MLKILFLGLLVALFLFACSKKQEIAEFSKRFPTQPKDKDTDGFTLYTIRTGEHYCDQNFPKSVKGTKMEFTALFDSSAIYDIGIKEQADANKLWGFSEGLYENKNSARFAWRWYQNQLQIMAYIYSNGVLLREPISYDPPVLCAIPIGQPITMSIEVKPGKYIFTVGGQSAEFPRHLSTTSFNGYQQYPYFGGNVPAPHKISILIKN